MSSQFDSALKEVLAAYDKAIDAVISEVLEPLLADLPTPEKKIGKPADQWTPEDIQYLVKLYGEDLINKTIAKKQIESYRALKAQLEE